MNRLLIRTLKLLVLLEFAYLVIINVALNMPLTQNLINQIKPDKFSISWTRAWSLYPFRVSALDLSLNGQTRSQQWQLDLPRGSASIALIPLLSKRVNISRVEGFDVDYAQRPRPKAGRDVTAIREFFPPIAGRSLEITPPILPPLKQGKGWKITVSDIRAHGKHTLWLYQAQFKLQGTARADLAVQTRGGPFSLTNGTFDLNSVSMKLNRDNQVFEEGQLNGKIEIEPFIVRQNKGIKALKFINLDVNIQTQTRSLVFLNYYLQAFQGMTLAGSGEINGRLVLSKGNLRPPTDLNINAKALELSLLNYRTKGDGRIRIEAPAGTDGTAFLISFSKLETYYGADTTPMLSGSGLSVSGTGSTSLIRTEEEQFQAKSLGLLIRSIQVPDLSRYQRFLPDKWALKLRGGEGQLQGRLDIDRQRFDANIKLSSEQAEIGFHDYQFNSNLEIRTKLNSPDLSAGKFDLSGTYIKLDDARIGNAENSSKPWFASINIDKGSMDLNLEELALAARGTKDKSMLALIRQQPIKDLLSGADNDLQISGRISDLRWLNQLVNTPYDFAITGSGNIDLNLVIESGWLANGTRLTLEPQRIGVNIMDYRAEGDGELEFKLEKGGPRPDISLLVELREGIFKRRQDTRAFIENVHILLKAFAPEIVLKRNERRKSNAAGVELNLKIISATVLDMRVYNQYFPAASPLKFTAGQADLSADIQLGAKDAKGNVRLVTRDLQARVDEQTVSGELDAQIVLAGGTPGEMKFDIQGSSIILDKIRVSGNTQNFSDDDWAAQIRLSRGETVWRKPIQLDMEADITMSNSIPLVSMMVNKKGKQSWLSQALSVDDVSGTVQMNIANQQIMIPYAYVRSDKIDVGAKAVLSSEYNDGILFVRYKKLHGIMKIRDGKRNIDILKARIKFDEYSPENVIQERNSRPPEAEASAPAQPNY